MRPITDDMQDEIDELRDTVDTLRRQGRVLPVMTIREYYAGLAMQGIMTTGPNMEDSRIARRSAEIADALIAELQREDSDD